MSKEEYLVQFKEALLRSGVSQETIQEVIEDYEEHFVVGKSNGKTEQEICNELGDVQEIVEEIQAMDSERQKSSMEDTDRSNEIISTGGENHSNSTDNSNVPFRKVRIDGISGTVYVTRGETLKADFISSKGSEELSSYEFVHYQSGDTFYIGIKPRMNHFFTFVFHHERVDISVQVPDFVEDIEVSNASGFTKVENINTRFVNLHTASGDITVQNISATDLRAKCATGNIYVSNCNGSKLMQNTSSGSIRCENSNFKEAYLKSASGSIEALNGSLDNFEAHTASGKIRCTAKTQSGFAKGVSGDISYVIQNKSEVRCEAVSGDVQIQIANPELGCQINFNTVSGYANILVNGMEQRKCRNGLYTYGNQESKIFVKTVSGDANIKQN